MVMETGIPEPLFTAPRVTAAADEDGALVIRSIGPLAGYPVPVMHSVRAWAQADPGHPMIAERAPGGGWRICGYGEAVAAADAIGQALLDRGLGPGRPLLVLSGNSVDHLLVTLGAMSAGVPVAPVSVAYSLQSHDHARIRAITEMIRPGAVFADDAERFAAALDAVSTVPAVVRTGSRPEAERLGDLVATRPGPAVDAAFAARFFSRLRLMFNAAAALPAALRQRLEDLAVRTAGRPVPVTGSWGATETAPAVTSAHYEFTDARCIGVPLPGAEVRLVPVEGAYEIRVKGPMVTPGYFGRPDLTAAAFDARGYYRTGDAVDLADPDDPGAGLV